MRIFFFEISIDEIRAFLRVLNEIRIRVLVPKTKRGKIGIAIALRTESTKTEARLHNDLVAELQNSLHGAGVGQLFHVIKLPNFLCRRIVDLPSAVRYLRRARVHLMVYGSLVQRTVGETQSHVFRLHGLVQHGPVSAEISQRLSKEFSEFLPTKVLIPEQQEVLGFEMTHQWLKYVFKYILGISMHLSRASGIALRIFDELQAELKSLKAADRVPFVAEMLKRLPSRQTEACDALMLSLYLQFAATRKTERIHECVPLANRLIEIDPRHLSARIMLAMSHFFNQEVESAIMEIQQIEHPKVARHYNLGFLLAFKGDIRGALEEYRKAFYQDVIPSLVTDTEVFISEVIEQHSEKVHLRFFRGLINYKAKADYRLAADDFRFYLNAEDGARHNTLVELSEKYLFEIRANVGTDGDSPAD